jgi:hypothetical protein
VRLSGTSEPSQAGDTLSSNKGSRGGKGEQDCRYQLEVEESGERVRAKAIRQSFDPIRDRRGGFYEYFVPYLETYLQRERKREQGERHQKRSRPSCLIGLGNGVA